MTNVVGGAGNDVLNGPTGSDSVVGDQGDDSITIGNGMNTVYGGMGNDTVQAGNGSNLIYGDLGSDTIRVGNGNNTVYGGTADSSKDAFDGADFIITGSGNNLVVADAGNDTVTIGGGAKAGPRFSVPSKCEAGEKHEIAEESVLMVRDILGSGDGRSRFRTRRHGTCTGRRPGSLGFRPGMDTQGHLGVDCPFHHELTSRLGGRAFRSALDLWQRAAARIVSAAF